MPKYQRGQRQLTDTEMAVLSLLAMGYKQKAIGYELNFTSHSIRNTLTRIYDKLGADNRVQAVLFALDMRVLDSFGFWGS